MASAERFGGYPAEFGYATAMTMEMVQLQGWEMDANVTETPFIPVGLVKPSQYITSRVRPEFRIRTRDMSTVLGVVDFNTGKCFDETSTFYVQEREDCGTFIASPATTQPGRTTENGFMFVESITADLDSADGAIMTLRYVPLWDGSATDIVASPTNLDPIASVTPLYTSAYFLASPYHNGVEIQGVTSVTINTGIQIQPAPETPGAYDRFVSIIRYEPEFTFRCLKIDEWDSKKFSGFPLTTSFAFYFQKVDTTNAVGDGRIAKATASHTKISFTGGKITVRNLSFDGTDDVVSEVSVKPTGAVTAATNSAIP